MLLLAETGLLDGHDATIHWAYATTFRQNFPRVRLRQRRFRNATEHTPISYVQHLRIHEAKRRLERTSLAIDRIGWAVGYEDPASFRRLFKRLTGVTPGVYRRKFRIPAT